jgi:FixJ family two-component response regulator
MVNHQLTSLELSLSAEDDTEIFSSVNQNVVVHLVDDDTAFLNATSRYLRAMGFTVKTFPSAREFLEQLAHGSPGCVIADLRMPGLSGLEMQAAMSRTEYAMPVIFLTAEGDIPSTVAAMRCGAEDFLEKMRPKEELLAAVRRALARADEERQCRLRTQELKGLFAALSLREREVLKHVVQGKLNKQIAADLSISERTVKAHRTAVTTKLGVPSVAELTRLVHEAGLFEENGTH